MNLDRIFKPKTRADLIKELRGWEAYIPFTDLDQYQKAINIRNLRAQIAASSISERNK